MTASSIIALDTGALVYWSLDPDRLSAAAAEALATAEQKIVSSISLWELGQKIKRRELTLPLRLNDYVDRLQRVGDLRIVAVDEKCWLRSLVLDWDHSDVADRTIVAMAMLHACDLVSSDERLRTFYSRAIW